jgi:hypothetical protein
MRRSGTLLAVFSVVLLAACSASPSPSAWPFAVHAFNVNVGTVVIVVNGQRVATLPCDSTTVIAPGGTVPELPWTLEVQTLSGQAFENGTYHLGGFSPVELVMRDGAVLMGPWPMILGFGGQQPCPSP